MSRKAVKIFRKWNRIIHRDFGYFFFGMTIIYSISGIAINHRNDWNANYYITYTDIKVEKKLTRDLIDKELVIELLTKWNENDNYKKHYFPKYNHLKVFLHGGGSFLLNLDSGIGYIEKIRKRPILYEMNFLHYNPGQWWTWFSDIFAGSLILIAVSGLFIIGRGKNSVTRRGAWLTAAGIIIPIIALFVF